MSVHPSLAAKLLARAAAVDNRTVSEAAALAWAESLDDHVTLADGLAAIADHYAETRQWIMPADVNARIRAVRKARVGNLTAPAPPVLLSVEADLAWRRAYITARADGLDDRAARDRANAEQGIVEPPRVPPPARLRALASTATRLPDPNEEVS